MPNISTSDSALPGGGAKRWPVLARLPEIGEPNAATARRSESAVAATRPGYRFDPPQSTERKQTTSTDAGSDRPSAIYQSKAVMPHAPLAAVPPQPHLFSRSRRSDCKAPAAPRKSAVLPESNPFAIPSPRLMDALAPAVRFLTLVILFAVAGTWFQMIHRRESAYQKPAEPVKTAAQQPIQQPTGEIKPANANPTAAGPLGDAPAPTSNQPVAAPELIGANGRPLPRVQTTDLPQIRTEDAPASPPTMARLRGDVESILRNANHDDHQPSLH
jgi:hypothetical protein